MYIPIRDEEKKVKKAANGKKVYFSIFMILLVS
jgi:hypothetical protein